MSEHKPRHDGRRPDDNLDFELDFLWPIPLPFGAERDAEAVAERGPGPDEDRTNKLIEKAAKHFAEMYERSGSRGLADEEEELAKGVRSLQEEISEAQRRVEVIAAEAAPGDDPASRSKRNFLKLAGGGFPFAFGNETSPVYQELAEIAKTIQELKFIMQRRHFRLNVLRNVRHQLQTFGEVRVRALFSEVRMHALFPDVYHFTQENTPAGEQPSAGDDVLLAALANRDTPALMEYISSLRTEEGEILTWQETFDKLAARCEELKAKVPYTDAHSMRTSYYRWKTRQEQGNPE